ncbi:MAG: CehA/McbA family metallohydrolase [Lachnospiraceae bacterium]|nr:CehA/McbA family metallohydrolase [Lachnospiraceae bacterium]
MEFRELFSYDKNWYKGNMHMHTTVSDGHKEPDEALDYYRRENYDFVAITDHWKANDLFVHDGMLVLPGIELDCGNMITSKIFHIVGVGMDKKIDLPRDNTHKPQELIDIIRDAGGIAILAHPYWSMTEPSDVYPLEGFSGVEIYNTISDTPFRNGPRADSALYFDIWAGKGFFYRAMAADDSHYYEGEQTSSFTMVNAKDCSRDSLLEAIKAGDFYASRGPRFLRVSYNDEQIRVECEGAEKVLFLSNSIWDRQRVSDATLGSAVYDIKEADRFMRIELVDKDGRKAWTSPFALPVSN